MIRRPFRKKVTVFDSKWKNTISEIKKFEEEVLLDFCVNKCGGECCCMEHRWLSETQVRKIFSLSKKESLYKMKNCFGFSIIEKEKDGTYSTNFSHDQWCPSFDKEKRICKIHADPLRPEYCQKFPFYYTDENGMQILEIFDCPALRSLDMDNIIRTAGENNIWSRCLLHM